MGDERRAMGCSELALMCVFLVDSSYKHYPGFEDARIATDHAWRGGREVFLAVRPAFESFGNSPPALIGVGPVFSAALDDLQATKNKKFWI